MDVATRIDLVFAIFGALFFVGNRFRIEPPRASLAWNSPPPYIRLIFGSPHSQVTLEKILRLVASAALVILSLGSAVFREDARSHGASFVALSVVGLIFVGALAAGGHSGLAALVPVKLGRLGTLGWATARVTLISCYTRRGKPWLT